MIRDEIEDRRAGGVLSVLDFSASWLVSAVVHAIMILVLGLLTCTLAEDQEDRVLTAHITGEDFEDLQDSMLEERLDELEIEQAEALSVALDDPGTAAFAEAIGSDAEPLADVGRLDLGGTMDEIGALFGEDGHGWATAGDGLGNVDFYGVKARGRKFVFVVDNSLSMNNGRFEAACYELAKSVDGMSPQQTFYVFFFSDTAYPLFYPQTAPGMVPATAENKRRLNSWLATVQLVLKTNAQRAVAGALAMNPDAVYILTDGAFTDNTAAFLLNMPPGKVSIHTVGMELQPRAGTLLQQISQRHHGSYKDVRVDPRVKMLAKTQPRKRNSQAGPVWGIALGQKGQQRPPKAAGRNKPKRPGGKRK